MRIISFTKFADCYTFTSERKQSLFTEKALATPYAANALSSYYEENLNINFL